MNKKLKRIVGVLLSFAVVFSMVGCTTYNNFRNSFLLNKNVAQERTINIGVYEPMSGGMKEYGNEEVTGIQIANAYKPTVLGKKVQLIYADNKSSIHEAKGILEEMFVSNDISVLLGSYGETLTLISGDFVKANNTPALAISSNNPLITSNNRFYFTTSYSETKQGDALAEFVVKTAEKKVVASVSLGVDDTVSATIKRFSNGVKRLSEDTRTVRGTYLLPPEGSDYKQVIENLKNTDIEAIFLAVSNDVAKNFITQWVENGNKEMLFLGTKEWGDKAMVDFLKNKAKVHAGFISEKSQDVNTTTSSEFVRLYKEKYGEDAEPTARMAMAFDAYMLAIKAIEEAKVLIDNTKPEDLMANAKTEAEGMAAKAAWQKSVDTGIPDKSYILQALLNIENYEGASGVIHYGGKNEASKSVAVTHYRNGMEIVPKMVDKDLPDNIDAVTPPEGQDSEIVEPGE